MNLSSGYFPPNGYRRKQTAGSYNFSLNNQNHHPATTSTLPSARSSNESSNGNETLLSSFMYNDRYRPHRQNDFANNHLFLAKRKLAGLFGQPTKSLHSKSDLIHLFDSQEPHRKTQQTSNKLKRSEGLLLKTSSNDHDLHLSVVNLDIKPPHPSIQTRDPLASIIRYRSIRQPTKISRQTTEIVKPANLHSNSLQIFADNHDTDEFNDDEAISDSMTVFDSSILTVKSIGPHNR